MTEKAVKQPGKIMTALYKLNEKDTDTVLYTMMCVFTVPALIVGGIFLWMVENHVLAVYSGCLFQDVLHLYCPGCGGTRSIQALLRGRFLTALYYHPAAVYGVVLYVVYFVSQTLMRLSGGKIKGMQFKAVYLYVMLGLIALNFVVRNVLLGVFHIPTL